MEFSLKKLYVEKQGSELVSSWVLGSSSSSIILCPPKVNWRKSWTLSFKSNTEFLRGFNASEYFLPLTQRIYRGDNQEWLNEINGNWRKRFLELRVCGGFPGEGSPGEWRK